MLLLLLIACVSEYDRGCEYARTSTAYEMGVADAEAGLSVWDGSWRGIECSPPEEFAEGCYTCAFEMYGEGYASVPAR